METVVSVANTFNEEQNALLKTILNERYFRPWSIDLNNTSEQELKKSLVLDSHLEIYITPTCNQKCEYCYLIKYPGIYPPEINNRSTILKNLDILLNWIIENKYYISNIDLFSGEIWHSSYGIEVLEKIYNAIEKGLKTDRITIPSNCSFVRNREQLDKIQWWINRYNKKNVRLCFSISVEGAVLENKMRPLNSNEEKTDDFYEQLFVFAKHNEFYFHPMVAAASVKDWIENHQWWRQQCEDYDMNYWEWVMMLEVRNNDWTDESIQHYLNFLDYLIDLKFKEKGENSERFFKDLLCLDGEGEGGYVPFSVSPSDTFAGCSVSNTFTVRLGDLAICPCHRTSYNKYLYGHFKVENDKIVDIIAQNPQMAIKILLMNVEMCHFGCDACKFKKMCLKGCYGSQLENMGDPFVQIPGVCRFFQSKYTFLAQKYRDMGIFEFIDTVSPYSMQYLRLQQTKETLEGILN